MPTGDARPSNIRAADLVGPINPVLNQSAVDSLADAFRKGQITSEDIISKQQEREQKKAEFAEKMSPAAVQSRQAQTQLAGVTAQSALELEQHGEAVKEGTKLYLALAPRASGYSGENPKLPDGKTDYPKMAEIGFQLAAQQTAREAAQKRAEVVGNVKSPDGTKNFPTNHRGEVVNDTIRKGAAVELIFPGSPGTVAAPAAAVPAAAAPAAAAPAATPSDYNAAVSTAPAPVATAPAPVATAPPFATTPVSQTVAAPAATTKVAGQTDPSSGALFLGDIPTTPEPAITPENKKKMGEELAAANAIGDSIVSASKAIKALNLVGPAIGSDARRGLAYLGSTIGMGDETKRRTGQRDLDILRSTKILEGAQSMKGNLSDKDVKFLQDTIPKLTDDESTWNKYLYMWGQMNEANKKIIRGTLNKDYSWIDGIIAAGGSGSEDLKLLAKNAGLENVEGGTSAASVAQLTRASGAVYSKNADGTLTLVKPPTQLAPPAKENASFFPPEQLQALATETKQPLEVLQRRRESALRGQQLQKLVVEPKKYQKGNVHYYTGAAGRS